MARRAGVLLNISSLPSPYGIGTVGEEARDFAKRIASMGFSLWQILPTVPLGSGDCPYAGPSAFAGNVLYIDPRELVKTGLISAEEAEEAVYGGSPYTADYGFAAEAKEKLLRKAFSRCDKDFLDKVTAFGESHRDIGDYALFSAIKKAKGGAPYWEWGEDSDYSRACANMEKYKDEYLYCLFSQYVFSVQWAEFKDYVNSLGVKLFGDMPIYVSRDSADIWAHPHLFLLNKRTGKPEKVAGVPPDYFSEEGQLWGNPLYDWAAMKKDGYDWWCRRISQSGKLYDIVRIDHFRAFASYWAVPATAKTAKEGAWKKGPAMSLFKALKGRTECEIVAEDLGTFGEDVVKLLDDTGFPGMRVVQFGFAPGENSSHLPHNYVNNTVAYVGTHDNNTLLGWLWEATPAEREFALDYCGASREGWEIGGREAPACRKIIESVWRSVADTAIISLQDMCGYGSDTRMNIPGEAEGNWLFRTTAEALDNIDREYYKKINSIYNR